MKRQLPYVCRYKIDVDTREQKEYGFTSIQDFFTNSRVIIKTRRVTIPSGDYSFSIDDIPWFDRVAVERKSMSDLFSSYLGEDREREERKLERLNKLEYAALVVEGTSADLIDYRCKHVPSTVDQAKRAEQLRNAVFKMTHTFPRVHWFFEPSVERAEEATWRILDWFYRNSKT